VSGSDKVAHDTVDRFLQSHEIENYVEGSKVYYILVPIEKAAAAVELLHAHAMSFPFSIRVQIARGSEEVREYPSRKILPA
jgi:hypothetical protein